LATGADEAVTAKDVGAYYLDETGNVWQLICYADQPTATLRRVDKPDEQRGGVVGAPIFDSFTRLVPQERTRL
jgi:hypothetical protein